MPKPVFSTIAFGFAMAVSMAASSFCRVSAQDAAKPTMIGGEVLPADAFLLVTFSPRGLLEMEELKWFPIEVIRVQVKEMIGVDPMTLTQASMMMRMDEESGVLQVVFALQSAGALDVDSVVTAMIDDEDAEPTTINGREMYSWESGNETIGIYPFNDSTVLIGNVTSVSAIVEKPDGAEAGPLAIAASQTPIQRGLTVLLAVDPVEDEIGQTLAQMVGGMPGELQDLNALPSLVKIMSLRFNLDGSKGIFDIRIEGDDEESGEQIEDILVNALAATRDVGIAGVTQTMWSPEQSDEMSDAVQQYAERVADKMLDSMRPVRDGNMVALRAEPELGLAGMGMFGMAGVSSIQPMLRIGNMDASNNMKQILLGVHNYHAAFNKLPDAVVRDADGNPLYSWRVLLLPFIEEQALWEEFNKDEPWDSEHNLALLDRMPTVFKKRGVKLEVGYTTIQAMVGDDLGMRTDEKSGFRDFLDGLANTILIAEGNAESAVPWSKPEDVAIDLEDPLAHFKGNKKGMFYVGLGDGSVRLFKDTIDPDLFNRFLTRAGGEVIDRDDFENQ